MNRVLSLVLVILLLSGCSKKFTLFQANSSKLNVENLEFEYLSLKTKVRYSHDKENVKASANIRMRKDSVIWFSLTPGLGIEAARGLISKDSIILLDKIHKKYSILRFKDLSENFHFDLDFNLVQSILLGNMIWPVEPRDKVSREQEFYKIDKTKGDLSIAHYVGSNTMKLEKLEAVSDSTNNSLQINYTDFELISDKILPIKANLEIGYTDKKDKTLKSSKIILEHNKVEIDKKKLRFTFNIPQKYQRN